jgi:hypothetical protein
MLMM